MHARMEELLNYIDVDLKWNIVKKGRRSMTRCPRKPGVDSFESGNNAIAFEAKKSGADVLEGHFAEKIVDAPSKKRRLVCESPSLPPQTPCLNGDGDPSPKPQTPPVYHEDSLQQCRSDSPPPTQKTNSKTGSRISNILNPTMEMVPDLDDFSGIELLAAAACSSLIHDNADHVDDFSVLKEHMTLGATSCTVDVKEDTISTESEGSSTRDGMVPDTQAHQKIVAPSKGLRLHWDLNTVMDEWDEPCNNLLVENCSEGVVNGGSEGVNLNVDGFETRCSEVEPQSHELSGNHDVVPVVEDCNGKTYEWIEDLACSQGSIDAKMGSKASDGESSASKSDGVESLARSDKCEDFSASPSLILREQTIVKGNSDTIANNLVHSNHKVQVGYDSPFEDGELREPIGWEENGVVGDATMYYESDNVLKTGFDTIENQIEAGSERDQSMEDQGSLLAKETINNEDIDQGARGDGFERSRSVSGCKASGCEENVEESDCGSGKESSGRKNGDSESRPIHGNFVRVGESESFDPCRQSRSSNIGDSYPRFGRYICPEKSKVPFRDCSRNDVSGPCVDSFTRVLDLKSRHEYHGPKHVIGDPVARSDGCRSHDSNQSRNYNPRGAYMTQNRRPSPSERNHAYGINKGPPVRSLSRDRYRGGSGFHPQGSRRAPEDAKPCYSERKVRYFSPNFNRPVRRSPSRLRSGSPIAWHFPKRKHSDTRPSLSPSLSPDHEARFQAERRSLQKPSNCNEIEAGFQFSNRDHMSPRQSAVAMIRRNQRFESIRYPERLKSDRSTQQAGRFSQLTGPAKEHNYKVNSDATRKHYNHHEKMNRVARCDDAGGMRRFRYAVDDSFDTRTHRNLDSFSRDARN